MSTVYRSYMVLFIYLLLDLISFSIILPLLPSILDVFDEQQNSGLYKNLLNGATIFKHIFHITDLKKWNNVIIGGILASVFSFLQFLSSPFIGSLSDIYGRKMLLIVTSTGLCISYFLWLQSQMAAAFSLFFLSRLLGGLSKANIGVATAIVSDVSSPAQRTKGMALVGVAFSLSFILGPLLGALLASNLREGGSSIAAAQLTLVLSLAAVVWLILAFKETLPREKRTSTIAQSLSQAVLYINPISLFSFGPVRKHSIQQNVNLRRIGFCYFTFLLIFSGLEYTLTFLTHLRFNYGSMEQGKMFLFIGAIMITVQGGFLRRLKYGNEKKAALLGVVILVPAFLLIGFCHTTWLFYLGLAFFSVSSGTVVPCLTSCVSLQVDAAHQGCAMGILRSLGALARGLGPLISSGIFWLYGPHLAYSLGALLLIVPIWKLSVVSSN